jgi:hypothetical protein
MFFTYLWRELRRRLRQAVLIALGLALGVGLVITVTQPPAKGSGGGTSFGFRQDIKNVRSGQLAAGTKIDINQLVSSQWAGREAGAAARFR